MTTRKTNRSFKKILYTTDFSDPSFEAFCYALSIAKEYDAKLFIVHVVDTAAHAAGFYLPHLSFEKLGDEMVVVAGEMLEKKYARYLKDYDNHESIVRAGAPHDEIIKIADDEAVDLVVMGSFGRTGLDRFVFGSVTERVIRGLKCPVLAIPPKK